MTVETLKQALQFVERETHLRTKSYRMLSDGVQGEFLQAFSLMVRPSAILEIGTFTGYATICLSRGLRPGGIVDTIEKDDEMTDIFTRAFQIAGADNIVSHLGDAKRIIPGLDRKYDIVYIDADKREYSTYFEMIRPKMNPGGYILADNVLWSGKLTGEKPKNDRQTVSIRDFDGMIMEDDSLHSIILPIRDGLAVMSL